MVSSTSTFNSSFLPEDFGNLFLATTSDQSIALQLTHVVQTDSHEFRIPIISGEVSASWIGENVDIPLSDVETDEEVITPRAIKALSKLSKELAADSNPDAAGEVGKSIGRKFASAIDIALFGNSAGTATQPKGIGSFTDAEVTTVAGVTQWENVDPFTDAIFAVETTGASLTAFIANPADALILAKLKRWQAGDADGAVNNEPLLATDATSTTTRRLAGLPLHTSPAVPVGTVYGLDTTRVYTVVRSDVEIERDDSAFFGSFSVAVRGVARVGFGYPQPKAIARIKLAA